ncbi:hypothetical protein FOMG_19483, partial [Fusarium oxysporum f. sp. melonis 26406]
PGDRNGASPTPRTGTSHDIPEWRRDKYILGGYRPLEADYLQVIKSLSYLHNETCNVYTHLIGSLLLPSFATAILLAALVSIPKFRTLPWCSVRVGAYAALGASAFIPLLHGVQ